MESQFDYFNVSPPEIDLNQINEFGAGAEAQDVNAWIEKADNRYQRWIESKKKGRNVSVKKRKLNNDVSFVKKENIKGQYIIKITIEALNEQDKARNVNVQYVTKDFHDSVLDETEDIIKKNSNKICVSE